MTSSSTTGPLDPQTSPQYFNDALNDAERLLKYAAEIGIDVTADTRAAILRARTASTQGWSEQVAADLLAALTSLAARLKPVTAESLKAYHDDIRPTVHNYLIWAIILACVIIPASIATFVTSAISKALRDDITTANALAVKLQVELGNPTPGQIKPIPSDISEKDLVADLQEYASTVRTINARARKLNKFVLPREVLPIEDSSAKTPEERQQRRDMFELHVPITDPIDARDTITKTYQDVRYFALTLLTDVAVFYGALSACVLPVLYALLGTCAYLLRTFEDQMSNRTFIPSAANSARFVIAAIGGAVVGLFNNLTITDQASVPPLALAFLVGYAVDVFFAFLEGLLRAFTKTVPNSSPRIPPPAIGTP
jgi:hypothetical protein